MKQICMLLLLAALCACSGDDSFKISGEISGKPTMNIYVKYYASGAVQTSVAAVRDGSFEFTGSGREPALLEILDSEYRVLGRAYVKNGDRINLTLDRHNPFLAQAEGDEVNSRWCQVQSAAADTLFSGTPAQANAVVERYIAAHPTDVVGTLLFLTCYDSGIDPLRADSVLGSIDPDARPGALTAPYTLMSGRWSRPEAYAPVDTIRYRTTKSDSALVLHPSQSAVTLMAFSDETSHRADSVVPPLRRLAKAHPRERELRVVDFVLMADTAAYKRAVARDSASWIQAWVPGGVFAPGIDRLALPAVPYYIVADSTGRQIYRGPSAEAAVKAAERD